ncbi:MAG TPA: hypothetical protein PLH57_05655 [Oligoflexia bacterium]|nr:hypothetical protein [Oligoflexia bacterium]
MRFVNSIRLGLIVVVAAQVSGCRFSDRINGLVDSLKGKVPVPTATPVSEPSGGSGSTPTTTGTNTQFGGLSGGQAQTLSSPSFRVNGVIVGSRPERQIQ